MSSTEASLQNGGGILIASFRFEDIRIPSDSTLDLPVSDFLSLLDFKHALWGFTWPNCERQAQSNELFFFLHFLPLFSISSLVLSCLTLGMELNAN